MEAEGVIIMFDIDKVQFGEFLSIQRKKKGFTQKELATRLFISDKAVSKWERGASMPDISLLIPLADILDVTVTELLEGRENDKVYIDANQVENLVKKALILSEESPERAKEKLIKQGMIFGVSLIVLALEGVIFFGLGYSVDKLLDNNILLMVLLSLIFGAYFRFGVKERLPTYYDDNKISAYNDGIFKMNIPGIHFNNSNWPYIVRAGRIWSVCSATILPMLYLLINWLDSDGWNLTGRYILLVLFLGGLFTPIYIVGKKYE